MSAVVFDHVDIVFGDRQAEALALVDKGAARDDILKATGAEDIASSGEKSVSTHGVDSDRQATDLNETDRIRPSSVDSTRLEDERENRKVVGGR